MPADHIDPMTKIVSLTDELADNMTTSDIIIGRRACTRALNQLISLLHQSQLSRDDYLTLFSNSIISREGDIDVTFESTTIISILLSLISNENEFSIEGHRETSINILNWMLECAYARNNATHCDEIAEENSLTKIQSESHQRTILVLLFHKISLIFQCRTQRSSHGYTASPSGKGTMIELMEPSEHIRLLLLELIMSLSSHLVVFKEQGYVCGRINEILIKASSRTCQTFASATLLDPCPEVQRASCSAVEVLAKLCPLSIQMNAAILLTALAGRNERLSDKQRHTFLSLTPSITLPVPKHCLLKHRHAKIRCKALTASVEILLCCSRICDTLYKLNSVEDEALEKHKEYVLQTDSSVDSSNHEKEKYKMSSLESTTHERNDGSFKKQLDTEHSVQHHLSHLENLLIDIVLPGWEELLKSDTSTSVRVTAFESIGRVASIIEWSYNPRSPLYSKTCNHDSRHAHHSISTVDSMDLGCLIEIKILSLLLLGVSDANVSQVQAITVQVLSKIHNGNAPFQDHTPCLTVAFYFNLLIEYVLFSCSFQMERCHFGVSSLKALQILLSMVNPSVNDSYVATRSQCLSSEIEISDSMIRHLTKVLSNKFLVEECEILHAAMTTSRILGSNDLFSELILKELSNDSLISYERSAIVHGDNDLLAENETTTMEHNEDVKVSSPHQFTSTLLLLDGLMNGYLSNDETKAVLQKFDSKICIPPPTWFHRPHCAAFISSILCHPAIINNVATNSSMARALLSACTSFVKCTHRLLENGMNLKKDNIVDTITSISYLMGCPKNFGFSRIAMKIFEEFTSSNVSTSKFMIDDYFRQVLTKIYSSSSFPWKQSTPAFLAIDALLRATKGSTLLTHFDLVAPLFIHHLSEQNIIDGKAAHGSKLVVSRDELAEEYSFRIPLMALLQSILSDDSFTDVTCAYVDKTCIFDPSSPFSTQFTTDVLISVVLSNLVWKPGGLASALRKISAATLFSLLSHHGKQLEILQKRNKDNLHSAMASSPLMDIDSLTYIIPILCANLDDMECTTRELCCICLSLILEQMPVQTFQNLWNTDVKIVDSLYPRLVGLLDDSYNTVRLASCATLEKFLSVASAAMSSKASCDLGLSAFESIISCLMITLDDPDSEIQDHIFQVLLTLLELPFAENHVCYQSEIKKIIRHQAGIARRTHRELKYSSLLLQKVGDL